MTSDQDGKIIDEPLEEALSRRYLAYALSTITARALPDVRDGLKPVHRRLLYAMRQLRLRSSTAPKKSARVVGDVIGRLHPHGDQAVYDALVRLAQDFSVRYRLIDGQGNFGNVDGDKAAAMRYTESRLTAAAELLLEGLDEDAVVLTPTYDEQEKEPEVLPAGFPNLLLNGASGIAVGMATSIPPHNAAEVIDAILHLIHAPDTGLDEILTIMPGPDFPTGGQVVEPYQTIRDAYATGRGALRLRARWHKDNGDIIVTEIPFQVGKARLIGHLAELIGARKLPHLADIRDESTDKVRIVLEPKSPDVDLDRLMEDLFALSDLQVRFPFNMNALDKGRPRLFGLLEMMHAYLAHRREVILRRSHCRMARKQERLHIVAALVIVYAHSDEVIALVRDDDDPAGALMQRFELDQIQAEAILAMRLRALRRLEEEAIHKEYRDLKRECAGIARLIGSEKRQWREVEKQLRAARRIFDPGKEEGKRRTDFAAPATSLAAAAAREAGEPVRIILSRRGWIRALDGHKWAPDKLAFKTHDALAFHLACRSTDRIVVLASHGRAYCIDAGRIAPARGFGEPFRLLVDMPETARAIALFTPVAGLERLVLCRSGVGFVANEEKMRARSRRSGREVMTLGPGGELAFAPVIAGDMVAMIDNKRRLSIIPVAAISRLGRGRGARLIRVGEGGVVADVMTFASDSGFFWLDGAGRRRQVGGSDWKHWLGNRGQAGRPAPRGFNSDGRFGVDPLVGAAGFEPATP